MAIKISDLENASFTYASQRTHRTFLEAKAARQQTAFLSHSHKDAQLAKGLQVLLKQQGWDVYIDWEDSTMPETPDRQTAEKIQTKIRQCNWFLFLATPNSTVSRWCPWEIGYADGKKPLDSIFIIPTTDNSGKFYGNEYLQLYRRIDLGVVDRQGFERAERLCAFRPNEDRGPLLALLHISDANILQM